MTRCSCSANSRLVIPTSKSASRVASVASASSLTTVVPFNLNNTTGKSVNNGAVLPYVIGRAQAGNMSSAASTNDVGVASTTLNYPVSELHRQAAIWAQGTGTDTVAGGSKVIADIAQIIYPGLAPSIITASPNPIPATARSSPRCV